MLQPQRMLMCSLWQQGTGLVILGWGSHPVSCSVPAPATWNCGTEPRVSHVGSTGPRRPLEQSPLPEDGPDQAAAPQTRGTPARCQHPSSPGVSTLEHCCFQLPFPGPPALPYTDAFHTNTRLLSRAGSGAQSRAAATSIAVCFCIR